MMPAGLWKRSALAAVCCVCMALASGQAELFAADGGERRDFVGIDGDFAEMALREKTYVRPGSAA